MKKFYNKKTNCKKLIFTFAVTALSLPLLVNAQSPSIGEYKVQYEDFEGVPKSLRKAIESGVAHDSGYAIKEPTEPRPGNFFREDVSEVIPPLVTEGSNSPIVHGDGYQSNNNPDLKVNSDNVYRGHIYSEAEAKNAAKLGRHALSEDAIVGSAPTAPVKSIAVDRSEVHNQKKSAPYILEEDGTKYELKGNKVNIYDGILIPEGYEIEKKTIRIPTNQLKGINKKKSIIKDGASLKSDTGDIKKNSGEYLVDKFVNANYQSHQELGKLSFDSYQIASSSNDNIFFPESMISSEPQERVTRSRRAVNDGSKASTTSKIRRPANLGKSNDRLSRAEESYIETEKKSLQKARRPANITLDYNAQADYVSDNSGSGVTGYEYTMETLLASAYQKNPDINSAREALKAADESVPQAFAGYLPSLDISISKGYSKSGGEDGNKETFNPYSQALNLNQSIFGGGETYYAVEAAKKRILAARNELQTTEQSFLLEAINAYIDLIFNKKVLLLAENNEEILNEQLRASKERFIIGDATRTDVAQSEARLANAVSNRVIANNDYTNSKSNFKRIFLMEPPEQLPMPTALPEIPETFEISMTRAVAGNPELNRAKNLMEVREYEVDTSKSQLYPQLDLSGNIGERDGVSGSNLIVTESESITLNLTVPLYNRGTTYSRIRESQDRKNQSRFDYQSALNFVRDQLIQAWQALTTTASNIEATKASLVASEYALEGVKEEQKEGARTILDVLDAEQERFQSEISHARAIKDSVLAVYQLKNVLGELTPGELSMPIKNYNPESHYNKTKNKFFGF